MIFFDAHCDILSKIDTYEELFANTYHWDANRALLNGPFLQVFSTFAGDKFRANPGACMEIQINKALEAQKNHPEKLRIIYSLRDLKNCLFCPSASQIFGLLEAEGAEILRGSLKELVRLFGMGLRILTIAWNYDNEVCDSVAGENIHNGLSNFGYEVIEKAQELGILIDLSHSSDKTFEDVLSVSRKPVAASHSNSRALCNVRRNITDSQAAAIAKSGGVIGLNLNPAFLHSSGNASFMDIIKHVDYFSALVGTSFIGLGCDFDGIPALPRGIRGVEDLYKICEELLRLNYSEESVKAIAGGNFFSLLEKTLPNLSSQ